MGAVDEAVEDGVGDGGIVEPGVPMLDRQLAGNDSGFSGSIVDDFERVVARSLIESRDREAFRLQRCHAAALGPQSVTSVDEALLFQLGAEMISGRSAIAAGNLVRAAEGFDKPVSLASEALRRGLIVSLPRFRERLLQQLGLRA